MSCSIDEDGVDLRIDFDAPALSLNLKNQLWSGRQVQSRISDPIISIPCIPDPESVCQFCKRNFVDLTFGNIDDEGWALAVTRTFIERNSREDLMVEGLLGLGGLIKDPVNTVGKGMDDLSEELCHAARQAHQWCKEHPMNYPETLPERLGSCKGKKTFPAIWTNILSKIRQGLEIIGNDLNEPELSAVVKPEMLKTEAPIETKNGFSNFFEILRKGLQTIGEGMCEPELLEPNSPLDILNKAYKEQVLDRNGDTSKPVVEPITSKTDIPTRSCYFKTDGKKIRGMGLGFTPGMNTSYEETLKHAYHIKKFAGDIDICIEGVYNHSNGVLVDLCEIFFFNYFGVAPKTTDLLIENWTRFYEENKENPHAKYLQFAHSMGSIIVDAALRKTSKEIRDQIIVVTVGTAKVVSEEMCYKSFAYRSRSDFVHLGQDLHTQCLAAFGNNDEERTRSLQELAKAKEKIIILEPAQNVTWNDHNCESPTNDFVFSTFIREYLDNKGEYK